MADFPTKGSLPYGAKLRAYIDSIAGGFYDLVKTDVADPASEIALASAAAAVDLDANPASALRVQQDARLSGKFAALGSVAAEVQSGATAANKITNAAAAAAYGQPVVVSRSLASSPNPIPPLSDLAVVQGRMIMDYRRQVGTVSNRWQRGSMQVSEVFGADQGAVGDYAADNGSIIAVDAILTAGTGGNGSGGTVARGENVAGYFGTHRSGGTRSGWAINTVTTTEVAPASTHQTIGVEVDINNNSGVAATASTVVDGVVVLSGGTNDPRHGLDIGSANATKWSKGVVVSGVKDIAIEVASGPTKGIVCNAPSEFGDTLYVGAGLKAGADAKYISDAEVGTHQWRTLVAGVDRQIGELTAHGQMTLSNYIGGTPTVKAGGSATNVNLALSPKGTGVVDIQGPAKLGEYTTAGRPSAVTVGRGATVYDTTLSKPIYSDGATWRDAMGTAV